MRNPDAVLLCGGAGLRLRDVTGNAPKSMASVAGRPFLELLFRQLQRHGFERVILAVGYQQDVIRSYFGERSFGMRVLYSAESFPLGTGGALRNSADLIESEAALIMNGDSYTDADLSQLVVDHREANADVSMVLVPADGRTDCGSVRVDGSGRLVGFDEKNHVSHAQYLNAGVYLLSRDRLCDIPSGVQVSLEREVFPRWLAEGKSMRAFVHAGECVDIGTPQRYQSAQDVLAHVELEAGASGRGHQL